MSVWASCFGMETVSLRYFNVFGPRQDPSSAYSGVLSLFMKAVLERRAPTIFGDGEQSRDFTYVEDVVALNIKAAEAPASVSGRVYNGGNGGRITLNQAWAMLQKIEGVAIAAKYGPPRAGDVHDSQADTTAACRDLGHDPKFTFRACARRWNGIGRVCTDSVLDMPATSRVLRTPTNAAVAACPGPAVNSKT